MTDQQHRVIKAKANDDGVSLAELGRRLFLAWVIGDIKFPQGRDYKALVDAAVDYYVERANG